MGLDEIFTASVFASAIRLATPYIFAALGETFAQRSGVLNLGVDGMMLMGAFTGFYAVFSAQQAEAMSEPVSLVFGVLVALDHRRVDGLGDGFRQCHVKGQAGHQRHRRLPLRLGIKRAAVSAVGGHAEVSSRFPAHQLPGLDRFAGAGRDFVPS